VDLSCETRRPRQKSPLCQTNPIHPGRQAGSVGGGNVRNKANFLAPVGADGAVRGTHPMNWGLIVQNEANLTRRNRNGKRFLENEL